MTSLTSNYDVNSEIVDDITDGIIVTTQDDEILSLGENLHSLLKAGLDGPVIGKCLSQLMHPEISPFFFEDNHQTSTFYLDLPLVMQKVYKVKKLQKADRIIYIFWDRTMEKNVQHAFDENLKSIQLAYDIAEGVIQEDNPKKLLDMLFDRLGKELNLDVYFNYLIDPSDDRRMKLNNYRGVRKKVANHLQWLNIGEGVCGKVAEQRKPMVIENVQQSSSPFVSFIQPLGVSTYACFPLLSLDKVIGTLSFGSMERIYFSQQELEMLEQLAHHVSKSMERWKLMKELKKTNVTKHNLNIKLKRQQKRLMNIFEGALDGIMITNQKFKMLEINKAGLDLLGMRGKEGLPMSFQNLIVQEHQDQALEYALELERTGRVFGEVRVQTLNYQERIIGFSGVQGINPNQNLIMFRDITRQKHLERKMLEAKKEAEIANHVKTDFLLQMSHEFRTPLNTILGYSELLEPKMEGRMLEKDIRRLRKISDAGDELLQMVNQILDQTRLEYEQRRESERCFLVATEMSKVYHYLSSEAEMQKLNFSLTFGDFENAFLKGEEESFFLALKEFVHNAIIHNVVGGIVSISGYQKDELFFIDIIDTGVGLSPSVMESIRNLIDCDEVKSELVEEVGLGILLAIRLLKELGASVTLESTLGEGTTFTVALPIYSIHP